MGNKKIKRSGIVRAASRGAGVCVGTAAAVGKKVVEAGRPVEGTTDLESDFAALHRELEEAQSEVEKTHTELVSHLQDLEAEKQSLISELEQARHEACEARANEGTVKARVVVLESDLAAMCHELHHSEEITVDENRKSHLPSDDSAVQKEAQIVPFEQDQDMVAAIPFDEPVELCVETTAAEPTEAETPGFADVSPEDVEMADFPDEAEKILFSRVLSGITSCDIGTREDAAKAMGGIRHELSVRALSAQILREPSQQVRQECVKSLTKLGMKEGVSAVVRALSDQVASVRLAAVWGLYHLARADGAAVLAHMFTDQNEEVRRRAVICVGWLGQGGLAVELLPLLIDSSVSVRLAAVEVMGRLGSKKVVLSLINCLNDSEKSIRKAALCSLRTITGKKMGGPFPANEKSLQRLIARWREWWNEQHQEW